MRASKFVHRILKFIHYANLCKFIHYANLCKFIQNCKSKCKSKCKSCYVSLVTMLMWGQGSPNKPRCTTRLDRVNFIYFVSSWVTSMFLLCSPCMLCWCWGLSMYFSNNTFIFQPYTMVKSLGASRKCCYFVNFLKILIVSDKTSHT